jgi:hypothetical protein
MEARLSSDDTACFAFDLDPDTGRCTCRHDEEHHEGTLGGCEICAYDLDDTDMRANA